MHVFPPPLMQVTSASLPGPWSRGQTRDYAASTGQGTTRPKGCTGQSAGPARPHPAMRSGAQTRV